MRSWRFRRCSFEERLIFDDMAAGIAGCRLQLDRGQRRSGSSDDDGSSIYDRRVGCRGGRRRHGCGHPAHPELAYLFRDAGGHRGKICAARLAWVGERACRWPDRRGCVSGLFSASCHGRRRCQIDHGDRLFGWAGALPSKLFSPPPSRVESLPSSCPFGREDYELCS